MSKLDNAEYIESLEAQLMEETVRSEHYKMQWEQLRSEVEALRLDKVRLDWMIKFSAQVNCWRGKFGAMLYNGSNRQQIAVLAEHSSEREAIDAAMLRSGKV